MSLNSKYATTLVKICISLDYLYNKLSVEDNFVI